MERNDDSMATAAVYEDAVLANAPADDDMSALAAGNFMTDVEVGRNVATGDGTWGAAAAELTPPVPFVVPEFEDDDLRKKEAIDAASSNNRQQAETVAELRPPVPFVDPQVEGDNVHEQTSTVSPTTADEEMQAATEHLAMYNSPSNQRREYEESPHVRDDGGLTGGNAAGVIIPTVSSSEIINASVRLSDPVRPILQQGENSTPIIPEAFLVEEEAVGEVVVAERVTLFERKRFAFALCFLLVLLAVLFPVLYDATRKEDAGPPTDVPSMQPSSSPSFDPRPTLEIVQTRGHIMCGLRSETISSGEGFLLDLCRAVASVIFGNPDSFVGVPVTVDNRFQQLHGRSVDLLLYMDTHTIEREVRERTTGAGFTFSSPYYYDGMAYLGNETLVECAEKQMRYAQCSSLHICAVQKSTGHDFVQSSFPSDFFTLGSSLIEITEMLLNDTCNVIVYLQSNLLHVASNITGSDGKFTVGDKLMTHDPLGIVTRNDDREFSDIINWVVQALFYGEEQGLTKNFSLCQNYIDLTSHHVSDLNFMNAVHCVGNYGEILSDGERNNRGMNQINNGTTGMLYAIPFGELENLDGGLGDYDVTTGTLLDNIRKKKSLNCGVVVPDGFDGEIATSDKLFGMSVDYCRTLAAALFNGDPNLVNLTTFSENDKSSFVALNNGTIDVLAGGRVEKKYVFASSPSLGGFLFSTPYYYGNETAGGDVSFFSLATREDDVMFSSFVNLVVLATIHAQENLSKGKSTEMPIISVFGSEFALRDAIYYSGSYGKLYEKHFVDVSEEDRGRNYLNERSGPQIHSFPGLSP